MKFVSPSKKNCRYFENSDGSTYIPIGLNICFFRDSERYPESEILDTYQRWMTDFAANGGNFMRIWLGVPFFDIMPETPGKFDEKNIGHIRFIIKLAEKLNIKLKFTFEHFRRVSAAGNDIEMYPGAASFNKPLYAPFAKDINDYLASPVCRKFYLDKARRMAQEGFGDSPAVIAWELWNEINCLGDMEHYSAWSEYIIPELQKIFPKQMILQNLGSFSGTDAYQLYDYLAGVKGNGFIQAHRYADPGAELDVCRGPLDVLAADAIRELHDRRPDLPAILAEIGATEANHSLYSHFYALDTQGTLLHDALFAPFFAGSAGCGQFWHWDHLYIARHNLYWHFKRFANAIEGIDPVKEAFVPFRTATRRLRIYGLRGQTMNLYWCRDKHNTRELELDNCVLPNTVSDERIPAENGRECLAYLPWEDSWQPANITDHWINIPDFKRSVVLKCLK